MGLFRKKTTVNQAIDEEEDVNVLKEIVSLILYIAVVVLLIFLLHTFVGERTVVEGDSMNDTLTDGDSLWISKLSYRLHDPERFDIVVFPYQDSDTYYVKRIIGLPGETVQIMMDGSIYINGEMLEESYGKEVIDQYHIGRADEVIQLGDNEYFVMGDNRNDSKDSRDESVGNIKRDSIEGKVVFRLWPLNGFGFIED